MATITSLGTGDSGAVSRTTINDNFTNLNTDKAELASPTFTGTPSLPTGTTAVTQSASDNSTKLATTEYVDTATAGQLQTTSVEVSSAQLLDLDNTPVQIIPAPGAGKINVINHVTLTLDYNTTTYTVGAGAYRLVYGADTANLMELTTFTNFIQATADAASVVIPNSVVAADVGINAAINLTTTTAPETGDSPITVHVAYREVTI
jgi:hypothetical protein